MKNYWKIVAALILFCALPTICWKRTQANGLKDANRPTVGHLTDAYRELNADFFYGGLPERDTTIKLLPMDRMGQTIHRPDGSWLIIIDSTDHPLEKQAEMTLVHEMCHQDDLFNGFDEGINDHGDAFQACMIRVAKAGGFKDLW